MAKTGLSPFFRTLDRPKPDAPLLVYLPGMDGTGQLLHKQVGFLEALFDIHCLAIPPDDLTSWDQLAAQIVRLVQTELDQHPRRLVYLCGESFGGCLALKVLLHAPDLFTHLVLINPASSFRHSPWLYWGSFLVREQLDPIYQMSCYAFLPFLAALERIEADDRRALLKAMQSVTQESSVWRVGLLRQFEVTTDQLKTITQPTLLVASGRDRLLPAIAEAERLLHHLPSARLHILPNSGHACLLEQGVDLYEILETHQFLASIAPDTPPVDSPVLALQ